MNTRLRYSASIVVGAVLLTFSQTAWSLGLGDATVESFLNQPLAVKIQLITQSSDDLDSISAGMASASDYELIGASRDDISVPLQFSVESSQGKAYIAVSSTLPLNDPVVRLIVQVDWTNGRMLREYTLFLDPPTFSQQAPAPRIEPGQTAPQAAAEAAKQEPAPASPVSTAAETRVPTSDEYGPVQSGETLWRIAKDWSSGTGLNINKVMLAIQRDNPTAFSRNNINLLQRGAILRMPEMDEINSLSAAEANGEVSDQVEAFRMRKTMASGAPPLLADERAAPEPAVSEELQEQLEEAEQIPDSDPLSRELEPTLELVPPSEDSEQDSAYGFEESEDEPGNLITEQDLRQELARKEEELINQQQQNSYLEQRLSELEGQLAESQAGAVEDESLANMEDRLREERLSAPEEPVEAGPVKAAQDTAAQQPDDPWYGGKTMWWIGLLVLLAVVAGWFMSRRGEAADAGSDVDDGDDALREITDQAEDVPRVLDAGDDEAVESAPADEDRDESEAPEPAGEDTPKMPDSGLTAATEEAEVVDEESADPEIQLDLARAYISMGDKEAARVILEEVIANGTEDQQAEAQKMKDFL